MTDWTAGRGTTRSLKPLLQLALYGLAIALTALTVVAASGIERVAPLALCLVALTVAVAHRAAWLTLLTWPNLVVVTAVVILVIPIRREAIAGSLPFALEPYRVVVALVLALWVAALAIDARVRLRATFIDGPLLAVLGVAAASVFVNQGRIRELGVEAVVTKSLAFLVGFLLVFWLVVSVIRRFADVDTVVRALVATGAAIAFFALVEARTSFSVFDELVELIPGTDRAVPLDPSIADPVRGGRLRLFGSAQHPIEFSAIMAMLVPLGLYLVHTTQRRRWWLALGLVLLGALATVSRTGIVMLVVIVGVFLWLRPHQTIRWWPLAIPGVVVVHVAAPGALRELVAAFFPAGGLIAEQQAGAAGSGRLASLGPALEEVASRPLLGGGYGSRIVSGPQANSFIVDDMWLGLAMEVGLVGLAAWVWLFARFLRWTGPVAKHDQSQRGWLLVALVASVAAYCVGMLTFDTLSFIQVTFLFVIMLALAASVFAAGPVPSLPEQHSARETDRVQAGRTQRERPR